VIFGGFEKRLKFDGFLKGQENDEKHEKLRFWDFGAEIEQTVRKIGGQGGVRKRLLESENLKNLSLVRHASCTVRDGAGGSECA
jgi:hypothetical protein